MTEPPVRLCCFTSHYGPVCPDGTFMCCLCFEKFPVSEAYQGWDICQKCGPTEAAQI